MSATLAYGTARLDDGLRWYQREAALAAFKALRSTPVVAAAAAGSTQISPDPIVRAALLVLATGLGKTQIFSAVAGDWTGKILVLCHREELVDQARKRLEQMTGEWVQREQGKFFAELTTRIVVASVDTIRRQKRLERYPRDHFSLIIVDEAHHYVGNSYVRVFEHFTSAKILGVTATPDRADEKALGQVFDTVAYVMDIERGIDEGYLVPIRGRFVHLDEIDISQVGKSNKDLSSSQLDEKMIKAAEGVVRETLRLEPERQGIAFFPGVKSAQYAAEKFNALRPGSAQFISGQTPLPERQEIVRAFRRGDFQYLVNCMVATEGFDAPNVSLIIQARPTLSRALATQMVGRGTRTLPGLVDRYPERAASVVRKEAIRTSAKPDLMVLDFVGNCGRHNLATLEDILGGRYTEVEIKVAKKKRQTGSDGDPKAALEAARAELKALAAATEAKVRSRVMEFDPFKMLNVRPVEPTRQSVGATRLQVEALERAGIPRDDAWQLSLQEASKLLNQITHRRIRGLASFKQLRALSKFGVHDPNLSGYRAKAALNYIAQKGWGRTGDVDPKVLDRIINYREPGQEG